MSRKNGFIPDPMFRFLTTSAEIPELVHNANQPNQTCELKTLPKGLVASDKPVKTPKIPNLLNTVIPQSAPRFKLESAIVVTNGLSN